MIRAVTFDLWNTLIENKHYTEVRVRILAEALKKNGFSKDFQAIKEAYLSTHTHAYRVWQHENHRFVPTKERLEYILKNLSAQLPEDLKAKIVKEFEETALSDPPRLAEGVKETLECLSPRYKMGIISDSGVTPGRILRTILSEHHILKHFDVTVFSDETGYNKPHRIMFETALTKLHVKPHETMHVGDLLQTDVAGAKTIGMKVTWLNKEGRICAGCYKPDYEIEAVTQIIDVLNGIH